MNVIWARFADHGTVTRRNITDWKRTIANQKRQVALAKELAAKVRGYFTNPRSGEVEIPENLDGDRDHEPPEGEFSLVVALRAFFEEALDEAEAVVEKRGEE